ncbi:MAG TPA: Tn3 family transposase [Ktedonobacteraceae bacterium]
MPGQSCDPRTDLALFAAILAHGLNLPLTTMAESVEIPYHEMTHASDRYLREENVRRAITRVVDYHHGLALASAFGPGTTAMSDGIRFEVAARSLHAQYHSQHFGPRRGVTLHDMISDQYSHPYIQIIPPHMREKNLMVPMRDGVKLATDVYRPDVSEAVPTLVQRVPYNQDKTMVCLPAWMGLTVPVSRYVGLITGSKVLRMALNVRNRYGSS